MDLAASKCAICDIYCVSPHERSVPSLQVHGFKMGSNQSAAPITPLDAWAGVLESPLLAKQVPELGGAIEACQA
ncbi:hypothetical protein QC761_0090870 [Podospora bellae-mahoneyi]|uniref:Uncharacterized protein n=1 Tax=Podospora bellae-mahoneyi TaxID=2093777 RepID=A0ABR0FB82_9PEZI|nr:hypothetical protein QC761_0090870 [Podospora bellae-mahoneyi]